jgi:oligoribonuclease NrnB/cAMP/cGMP phosphodiesterase (DHH superfamily)
VGSGLTENKERVLVIGDWDADGVISTAITVYAQEKLGVFPLKSRCKVKTEPAGPRSVVEILNRNRRCWDCLVVLDIPYTPSLDDFLREYRALGCAGKIVYFDHHPSTIENARRIEERFAVETFLGKSATSVLLYRYLEGKGVRIPERLRKYALAVGVLEGRRHVQAREFIDERMVRLVASISKTLNKYRDRDLWKAYVKWLTNLLPTEPPKVKIEEELVSGLELSEKSDEEIKIVAMNLAMSSERLGYIRLVDARGKWRKRGASALATQIYKIVGEPVALIVNKDENSYLLIIKGPRGSALSIARRLASLGLLEDVGGHGNLSVSRLVPDFDMKKLKEALRRASIEVLRS